MVQVLRRAAGLLVSRLLHSLWTTHPIQKTTHPIQDGEDRVLRVCLPTVCGGIENP